MNVSSRQRLIAIVLALVIVIFVSGGSYAFTRYRISEDIEKGEGLAKERAAEISRQQGSMKRLETMTKLLSTLEDSLKTRPLDSMLVLSSANISYDIGAFEKAARYYRLFLDSIAPYRMDVRIDYAYSLFETGKQEEGMIVLQGVVKKDPQNQNATLNLAVMYAQQQRFDEALKWFRRCRDVNPESDLGRRAAMAIQQLETKA